MIARVAGAAVVAVLLVGAFTACASQPSSGPLGGDKPIPVDIGGGIGSSECAEAFPSPIGVPDITEASILPADWPDGPTESTLCSAAMTSDTTAVVQYVTTLTPEEVLAHYEAALGSYAPVISEGLGGHPILNGELGDFEFAIQTDGATGTYLIAAARGE